MKRENGFNGIPLLSILLIAVFLLIQMSRSNWYVYFCYLSTHPFLFFSIPWLTNSFIHRDLYHLFWNLLFIYFCGVTIEKKVGNTGIWILFLGGSIFGSLFSLFFFKGEYLSYGASDSALAMITFTLLSFKKFYFSLNPDTSKKEEGFSSHWLLLYLMQGDFLSLVFPSLFVDSDINHFAHLGGAAFGALFYLLFGANGFQPYLQSLKKGWWKEWAITILIVVVGLQFIDVFKFRSRPREIATETTADLDQQTISFFKHISYSILRQDETNLRRIANNFLVPVSMRHSPLRNCNTLYDLHTYSRAAGIDTSHPGYRRLIYLIENAPTLPSGRKGYEIEEID